MAKLEIRITDRFGDQVKDRAHMLEKTVSTHVRNLIEADLGGVIVPGRPPARPPHPNAAQLGEIRDMQRETVAEVRELRKEFSATRDIEIANKLAREVRETIRMLNDELKR